MLHVGDQGKLNFLVELIQMPKETLAKTDGSALAHVNFKDVNQLLPLFHSRSLLTQDNFVR